MNHIVWSKQQQITNFSAIQYNINTNNWYCIKYIIIIDGG